MPNRLADALSPYLLQHADNPVDWYPWGDEAFEKAEREDKPVFLSVGYATCHWCHVMEHESFEDPDVARLLNEHFVPVKVDREERPDVDALYMSVTQALTGHGGWPMTVLLTPSKKPFYAGTYFPKHGRAGRPGMMELLPSVAAQWRANRDKVAGSAERITEAVRDGLAQESAPGGTLDAHTLALAYNQLAGRFDEEAGGFGGAPKFPTPHHLLFLLREAQRAGTETVVGRRALRMVEETLGAMRRGGLWDHLGFGFHRYSTDRVWKLPHFEKMLYDQALLAMAYTEAFALTRNEAYRRTAEDVFAYVARDLTSPDGAFFSAEDADSLNPEDEKEEGAFYVWTWDEVIETLGPQDGAFAAALFNLEREGNVRDEATRELTGQNVLFRTADDAEAADRLGVPEADLRDRIGGIRQRLLSARAGRPRPLLDDKVLTDWNGLMIAALARAAWTFDAPEYAGRAARAADFLLSTMQTKPVPAQAGNGRLLHRYRKGEAGIPALLDDYAFLVWGLVELYQATFEPRWLRAALDLHRTMHRHFGDDARGGLFLSPDDGEVLLVRQKAYYDGAIPSGNAVAALNGLRLGRLTGETALEDEAGRVLQSAASAAEQPMGHTMGMVALAFATGPSQEITVAGEPGAADTDALLGALRTRYLPNAVVHLRPPDADTLADLAPYTEAQAVQGGAATAYVCEDFACQQPTTDPADLARQLDAATG
ncbi:MAG: thioredoxin domain-containing protein [Bacteroidota bacterium]